MLGEWQRAQRQAGSKQTSKPSKQKQLTRAQRKRDRHRFDAGKSWRDKKQMVGSESSRQSDEISKKTVASMQKQAKVHSMREVAGESMVTLGEGDKATTTDRRKIPGTGFSLLIPLASVRSIHNFLFSNRFYSQNVKVPSEKNSLRPCLVPHKTYTNSLLLLTFLFIFPLRIRF